MRQTIFETPQDGERMEGKPLGSNDPQVLRAAMTPGEMMSNLGPGLMPVDRNVRNVERPRRGYGY